jgi:ATP synthase protein I
MSRSSAKKDETSSSNANATTLISYLLGGLAFWGGVGWVADRALGFSGLFLPIGLGVGLVGSIYLIYAQYVRS